MAHFEPQIGDVVVAVDFGTTRSAVAYTVVGGTENLVDVIPPGKSNTLVPGDFKTPTSLLIEGSHVSFGCRAEEKFAERNGEERDWKFFQRFKMKLHNAFEEDPQVSPLGGQGSLPLSKLIYKSLKYLVGNAMEYLVEIHILTSKDPCKVFWVLTIPAIWSSFAKSMMRKAAHKAGMIPSENSSRLALALEPECAASCCGNWEKGAKFIVADCGGGTLDITTHSIVQSHPLKLKELQPPCGGSHGATKVDDRFWTFVANLIGPVLIYDLKTKFPSELFELGRQWEQKKIRFSFDAEEDAWTMILFSNVTDAMNIKRSQLSTMVERWNSKKKEAKNFPLKLKRTKLLLPYWLMESFFKPVVSSIVEEVISASGRCPGLDFVVLNGGFGKCPMLMKELVEAFKHSEVKVLRGRDPDLAIVKGAAKFASMGGKNITSRKSRYTFGIDSAIPFIPKHPDHIAHAGDVEITEDGEMVLGVFSVHGRAGDDLTSSSIYKHTYLPLTKSQRSIHLRVLVTEKQDVFLSNETGIQRLCTAKVSLRELMDMPYEDREIQIEFHFGGAEVRCHVYNARTRSELSNVTLKFNFLATVTNTRY